MGVPFVKNDDSNVLFFASSSLFISVEKRFRWITKDLISISIIIYIEKPHHHIVSLSTILFPFFCPSFEWTLRCSLCRQTNWKQNLNKTFAINTISNGKRYSLDIILCGWKNVDRKFLVETRITAWFLFVLPFRWFNIDMENRVKWVLVKKQLWITHFYCLFM